MILNREIKIKVPMIPNYILCGDKKEPVSIADFTDEELERIGKQFTRDLILSAQKRRKNITS